MRKNYGSSHYINTPINIARKNPTPAQYPNPPAGGLSIRWAQSESNSPKSRVVILRDGRPRGYIIFSLVSSHIVRMSRTSITPSNIIRKNPTPAKYLNPLA